MTVYYQEIDCEYLGKHYNPLKLHPTLHLPNYKDITQIPRYKLVQFLQTILYANSDYDKAFQLISDPNFYLIIMNHIEFSIILVSLNYYVKLVLKKSKLLNQQPSNLIFLGCLKLSLIWLVDSTNVELDFNSLVDLNVLQSIQSQILMELDYCLFITFNNFLKWEKCILNFSNQLYSTIDIHQFNSK